MGPITDGAKVQLDNGPGFNALASARDISFFDDFIAGGYMADLALASESDPGAKFSEVANAGEWLVTRDVAPTIVIADAEPGGLLLITTGANANDFVSCQMNGEAWAVAALKDIYFEIRLKVDDANDTQWIVGLCSTDTTGTTVGPVLDSVGSAGSMIGFVQDGDTAVDIDILCQNGGTATQADSLINIVDNVFITLAFRVSGIDQVEYFINGVSVGTSTTNIPSGDALTLTMEVHSPTASSTLEVDYILCAQAR